MIDYTMPDDVRDRLHVPSMADALKAIATAKHGAAVAELTGIVMPSHHFHLYAEVGWAGALSPILGSLHAVGRALRTIADEPWCKEVVAEMRDFPGTLFFARRVVPKPYEAVRLVVEECDGTRLLARGGGSTRSCNRQGVWA